MCDSVRQCSTVRQCEWQFVAMRTAVCSSTLGRVCMAVRAAVCGCAALCGSAQQYAAVRAAVCGRVW